MLSWVVTLRSTLRRTRKSHAIRLFRAPSFTSSVSSYPPVSPSPIFRTFLQVPYPASPLFAILTKTPGVWGYSSHFGTAVLPTGTPYIIQVHSFHVLAHSFALFCIRKKINSLCFQAIPNSLAKTPGGGGSESSFLRRLDVGTFRCSFCIPNGVTGRSPIRPIAAKRLWCHNPQRYEISSRSGETTPLLPVSKNSERTSGIVHRRFRSKAPIRSGLRADRLTIALARRPGSTVLTQRAF